jgi:hypothetical protein
MRIQFLLWPLLVALALFSVPLACADAVAAVPDAPSLTWWQQILIGLFGLVSTLATAMLVPYLRAKAAASNALADDASMSTRQKLVERLKGYIWGQAAAFVERDFPVIAKKIVAGELRTADQIKGVLKTLGVELKNDAIAYFKTQGVDLLEEFGEKFLDDLIRRAADAVSPFPGKETAVALLSDGAKNLLAYGVHYCDEKTKVTITDTAGAAASVKVETTEPATVNPSATLGPVKV